MTRFLPNNKFTHYLKTNGTEVTIWLIIIIVLSISFDIRIWNHKNTIIANDVNSYYAYLPAVFIYKDISLDFVYDDVDRYSKHFWPIKTKIGKYAIITPMGMAIVNLPFFLITHYLVVPFIDYEADGYTFPYKMALMVSCWFYFLIGLFYLKKVLEKYFSQIVVIITLFSITLGTNLISYTTNEASMTHAFSFTFISMLMYYLIGWIEKPTYKKAMIMGLLVGIITLVRANNVVVVLLILLWNVKSLPEFKDRILLYLKNDKLIIVMLVFFFLVWSPQFIYWKYISGSFVYNAYEQRGSGFFLNNPQIYYLLFSYRKGWLVYTPIMVFALTGIVLLYKFHRELFLPILVYTAATIYVVSSWWCWWYGGGFGMRPLIDSYGVLALPFATFIHWVITRKKIIQIPALLIVVLLIGFNLFQARQYYYGAIHYVSMTKASYWETFGKWYPNPRFYDLLVYPDYPSAKKGIYYTDNEKPRTRKKNENQKTNRFKTIEMFEEEIRTSEKAMQMIESKAAMKNISVDSMIKQDALWLYKRQTVDSTKK